MHMKKAMGPNGLRSSGTGPTAKDVLWGAFIAHGLKCAQCSDAKKGYGSGSRFVAESLHLSNECIQAG